MVSVPTVIFGKTQTGKTYKGFKLAMAHDGPVVFCDVQWRQYQEMQKAYTVREVIALLHNQPEARVDFLLDSYETIGVLIGYLLDVHRKAHVEGRSYKPILIVFDEVWRTAPQWADATNPAVRVFTEGLQHGVIGLAVSQWASQTATLIRRQAYEWYIFALNPADYATLGEYGMVIPDETWATVRQHKCGGVTPGLGGMTCTEPTNHRYWRYDGDWYTGEYDDTESGPMVDETS